MTRTRFLALVMAATMVALVVASDGDLDPTFDGDGIALSAVFKHGDDTGLAIVAQASATQADAKLVMVGYSEVPSGGFEFAVVRYNNDGSLDTSFGGDGSVTVRPGGYYDYAYSVAVQSDGKIVVAGKSQSPAPHYLTQMGVVRLNGTDGSLDQSFGVDGIVIIRPSGAFDYANSVALQSDGKIVVAGTGGGPATGFLTQMSVARLNGSDGSLDTSFGGDGGVTVGPSGDTDYANSVALQSDGKIVVAGQSSGPATNNQIQMGVVRLNGSDGSLDASFGGDGSILISPIGSNFDSASAVTVQGDGQIVVVGGGHGPQTGNQFQFEVVRLNGSDGTLDTAFGGTGIVNTGPSGAFDWATAVAIQGDGRIVVAGESRGPATNGQLRFGVVRLNGSDGSLDTSFDADGMLNTGVAGSSNSQARAIALQSDGRIVVAGSATDDAEGTSDLAVVRYGSDGTLDASFDGDGMVTTNIGRREERPTFGVGMAVQSDGKVVMAGYLQDTQTYSNQFLITRFTADGGVDTSFGTGGSVVIRPGGFIDVANSVAIQGDGQIVVAGYSLGPATDNRVQMSVVRLNGIDGSLDTSFGGDGMVTVGPSGYSDSAYSVTIQADGKIVLAGESYGEATNFQTQMGVARLSGSDGSLDTSFGGDGMVTIGPSGDFNRAYSVAIQADGKIVLAGESMVWATNYQQFGVVRLNGNDGSLDMSFDGDGSVTLSPGGNRDIARSVALQADGRIVVAGYGQGPTTNGEYRFAVARLNGSDGSLDTSFDADGMVMASAAGNVGGRGGWDFGSAVRVQSDNRIVVAGYSQGSSTSWQFHFGVVRLSGADGSLDTSFDGDGRVTAGAPGNYDSIAQSAAIADDGKILVGGYSTNNFDHNRFMVARFKSSNAPLDAIAPTASATATPVANGAGWNATDVSVTWNWTDNAGGSGIDNANCTVSSASAGEGTILLSATCTDLAGNTGNASMTVMVDKTAPTFAPVVNPNPVLLNGTASATSGAADALSGLASESCVATNTASVGAKTVACTAMDNAGNVGNVLAPYQVVYPWTGFFQPVDNLPVLNQVKAGSAIPVRFSLGGDQGLGIFASGYPVSRAFACSSGDPTADIEQTVTAGSSSLSYDAASGQYTYVWKTEKSWASSCRQLVLRLADGTEHVANFKVR